MLVIDPSKTQTGIAVYLTGIPTPWLAKIKQASTADVATILRWAKRLDPKVRLVIEGQHVQQHGPKQKINWPSVTALMLSAHRWIVLAEFEGIEVEVVQPAEWQGPSFACVETHDATTGKKFDTKARSRLVVQRTWTKVRRLELDRVFDPMTKPEVALGGEVDTTKITKDECDAAVMGRWWRLHGKLKRAGR